MVFKVGTWYVLREGEKISSEDTLPIIRKMKHVYFEKEESDGIWITDCDSILYANSRDNTTVPVLEQNFLINRCWEELPFQSEDDSLVLNHIFLTYGMKVVDGDE